MQHSLKMGLVALVLGATGCSFAVRSPAKYRDDTQAVLDQNRAAIEACYNEALKQQKDLSGRVTVTFIVAAETGKLTNVAVDAAQSNAPETLGQCVVQSIEGLVLTPPDDYEGRATFMFDFTTNTVTSG